MAHDVVLWHKALLDGTIWGSHIFTFQLNISLPIACYSDFDYLLVILFHAKIYGIPKYMDPHNIVPSNSSCINFLYTLILVVVQLLLLFHLAIVYQTTILTTTTKNENNYHILVNQTEISASKKWGSGWDRSRVNLSTTLVY